MKKILLVMLGLAIVLIGCSSNDDLTPGIDKYDEGTHESLMEARDFFITYLESNDGDKDALNWLDKTNSRLSDVLQDEISTLYANLELKEALELANYLVQLEDDEVYYEVQAMIEKDYNAQVEFDKFSDFMKDKYDATYEIFKSWRDTVEEAVLGDGSVKPLKNKAAQILPIVSELLTESQEQTLLIEEPTYREAQTIYFNYLNSLERELTSVVTNKDLSSVSQVNSELDSFTIQQFNEVFSNIQQKVNYFTNSTDDEGNKLINIKGNLNLVTVDEEPESETEAEEDDSDE